MKHTKLSLVILMFSFLMLFGLDCHATRYSIDVRNYEFSPSNILTVRVGDTIHWEWKDGSHTTTSTTIPAGAATWDSPMDITHPSFDYIPTQPGEYHYKCTPHELSGMVAQFTVQNTNGVADIFIPEIKLYPNPFSDRISFNITSQEGVFIRHLVIYDISGKVLREVSFNDQRKFPEYIDLSDIPQGLTVFEFTDNLSKSYIRTAVRKE